MSRRTSPDINFHHANDCAQTGCPGHTVKCVHNLSTDQYEFFIDGALDIVFDENHFAAVVKAESGLRVPQEADAKLQSDEQMRLEARIEEVRRCVEVATALNYHETSQIVRALTARIAVLEAGLKKEKDESGNVD